MCVLHGQPKKRLFFDVLPLSSGNELISLLSKRYDDSGPFPTFFCSGVCCVLSLKYLLYLLLNYENSAVLIMNVFAKKGCIMNTKDIFEILKKFPV